MASIFPSRFDFRIVEARAAQGVELYDLGDLE